MANRQAVCPELKIFVISGDRATHMEFVLAAFIFIYNSTALNSAGERQIPL